MKSRGSLFTEKERGARVASKQGQTLASHTDHAVSEFRGDSPHASIPGETHSSSLGNGRGVPVPKGAAPSLLLSSGGGLSRMPILAVDKGTALSASPSLSAWRRAPESVVPPRSSPWPFQGASCP